MSKKKIKILLICANPKGTDPLRTAEEDRTLRESIQLSPNRNNFNITTLNAATIDDLRRVLLKTNFDILHFTGHGTKTGLVFEDLKGKRMVPESGVLAKHLARRGIKTVILNSCYSLSVGKITAIGLDYTIASAGPISDPAAIEFTRGFYDALGAGTTVPEAYQEGISAAELKGLTIDAILLARGEEYVSSKPQEVNQILTPNNITLPRTLFGIAIDTSGSMQTSIQNRDGSNVTRFESVQESITNIGIQVQKELLKKSTDIPTTFKIFIYAFGLRIGNGVADMASLWKATQNIDINKRIEEQKRKYEIEARKETSNLGSLADLARSYGFGNLVDSVTDAAKSSIQDKIISEIANDIIGESNRIGDVTLIADELAKLFKTSQSSIDENAIEKIIFGSTPMTKAAKEIQKRFQRYNSKNFDQFTLLVISDGEPTDGDPKEIFHNINKSGVTIVSCFVTSEDIADPKTLLASFNDTWSKGAHLMWDIASELAGNSPLARYLLSQGWSLEPRSKLFIQVNHTDVLKEFIKIVGTYFTSESAEFLPKGM